MIDKKIISICEKAIVKDLGSLNDIPHELANTIANIYYKYFQASIDNSSSLENYFMHFSKLESDLEAIPQLINGLRNIDKNAKPNLYQYTVTYLLDCLKYDIRNINHKTGIRRFIERKIKSLKLEEIPNLIDKMNI